MTTNERELVLALCLEVAALNPMAPSAIARVAEYASRLEERFTRRRGPRKILPEPTRKERKRAKCEAHGAETKKLRAEAWARADGRCEICGDHEPPHLHHIEGGRGRKRKRQRIDNVILLCTLDHDRMHRYPGVFHYALALGLWAERHGYDLPRVLTRGEKAIGRYKKP